MVKSQLRMPVLVLIILSTLAVSLISLTGVLFIIFKLEVKGLTPYLLSLAVGSLLGGAFLHLLPEAIEQEFYSPFLLTILGILLFFTLEKFLYWRHCHEEDCDFHTFTYVSLFGDAVHNFIDGLILAGALITNPLLGFSTFLAVVLHEIPQEIGDFGIYIHGGFSQKKALAFNLLSSMFCILGGISGYFFFMSSRSLTLFLIPLTAGGFIYIALSDLVPSLHKVRDKKTSFFQFLIITTGLFLMWILP